MYIYTVYMYITISIIKLYILGRTHINIKYIYIYMYVHTCIHMHKTSGCKVYPRGFGEALLRLHKSIKQEAPEPVLRQKKCISLELTDVEIFKNMQVGDLWVDADLYAVYQYLKGNKRAYHP